MYGHSSSFFPTCVSCFEWSQRMVRLEVLLQRADFFLILFFPSLSFVGTRYQFSSTNHIVPRLRLFRSFWILGARSEKFSFTTLSLNLPPPASPTSLRHFVLALPFAEIERSFSDDVNLHYFLFLNASPLPAFLNTFPLNATLPNSSTSPLLKSRTQFISKNLSPFRMARSRASFSTSPSLISRRLNRG